jgi:2,4-didehydro-3-deoxy-L-rhamnonate hydrolase
MKSRWEVELVAVIGRGGREISGSHGWHHVRADAGPGHLDRTTQFAAPPPRAGQFLTWVLPVGPHLVTPDEIDDPDDLELGCLVNGESLQKSRTRDMVFSVPSLVARLTAVVTLLRGDVIFTGHRPDWGS